MFTYCGNNPVNCQDPSGQLFGSAIRFVSRIIKTAVKEIYRIVNYTHNSKVDSNPSTSTHNRLINDQNGTTGNSFKYGNYSASWNGCETIAVHNAKVLNGIDSTLSNTMNDFQDAGAMIGFGALGSNPYAIGRVLDNEGIGYSRVGLDDITQEGTYIISFWNDNAPCNGLHTVAVSYDGANYTTYNLYGRGNTSTKSPYIYANNYICGYYLR